MHSFAIGGIQTHIAATHDNIAHLGHRLDLMMDLFPWVHMVVFSELAPFGPGHAHAEEMPGPTEQLFQEMAARHRVWLLTGSMFERVQDRIYNTASVIDPTGAVVGRYRKIFPFRPYETDVSAGTEFLVFDVPEVGRFGVSICYDMWFPETTRTLTAMGAEVILHPSLTGTIDRDVELSMVRATAAMFQCYVFDINGLGAGGIGRSIVVDPNGTVVLQAGDHEQLIPVEIDMDLVRHHRRVGLLGLGQPLKSFRDREGDFPVYDRSRFDDTYLRSLGPLEKRRRAGDPGAPISTIGKAPRHAEKTARPTGTDGRVRSTSTPRSALRVGAEVNDMTPDTTTMAASRTATLTDYYNASQLRADSWNRLKGCTSRLATSQGGRNSAKLRRQAEEILALLEPIESYWAFPGRTAFHQLRRLLENEDYETLERGVGRVVRALMSNSYRRRDVSLGMHGEEEREEEDFVESMEEQTYARPYFEVLIVDSITPAQEHSVKSGLLEMRRTEDRFIYEPVIVPSFEDALIAVLFNHNIQAVVIRYGFPFASRNKLEILKRYLSRVGGEGLEDLAPEDYGTTLAQVIAKIRPELDVYLVTDQAVEDIAGKVCGICRRLFYNQEDYLELHLNILRGVFARYDTPFFTALREYSKQPTGVFHALPISRGKSIAKSNWIKDMGEFYGKNIFLAETSATSGGLDSLLEPKGPIKKAQEFAGRAFGARHTFFATNGTSTCNKIVVQAVVRPGDIVLVDRDCHKSHHYGMVLTGAQVVYLDSYPLSQYSMYGAVPLREIKHQLLKLKRAGKLDRVKMLLLTNCTFDGVVYNVERFMEECLAIKPDLVFLWDEAWFAFARFDPTYRHRTAMHAADVLRDRYRQPAYRARYAAYKEDMAKLDADDDSTWLDNRLLPDPDRVRIRVYATQSTHKTLTSLRQGSMLHIHDQDYNAKVEEPFHEAFMTHTSTSPNYQILASLDVGRRQVELEGFELVQKQLEMAMVLRQRISTHPLLKKYFSILTVGDMIPQKYRGSGIDSYYDSERGWSDIWEAWANDEFALDATRVTLMVGKTGYDGDTFKNDVLMDRYGIQINKTSRNTVLFMTNIGTTRSSVAYLIEILVQVAQELDERLEDASPIERRVYEKRVRALTQELPPLPDFSRFHDAFRPDPASDTPEAEMRHAYFLAYDDKACDYMSLSDGSLDQALAAGREIVSAGFIIPYPPGFPILVPGQVVSREILDFMLALDVKEIHGYRPELGLRVFTEEVLSELSAATHSEAAG